MSDCHCSFCRKTHGAAFDGRIVLPAGNFDGYPPEFDVPNAPDRPREPVAAPIHGSCLCKAFASEATGEPLICRHCHCHCARCRKARSAVHASNLVVPIDGFRFTRGADRLGSYKVPDAQFFTQVFCRGCGSPMPRVDVARGFVVIAMGALDADPGVRPRNHIFVASKAPWFEITDSLQQFAEQQPV